MLDFYIQLQRFSSFLQEGWIFWLEDKTQWRFKFGLLSKGGSFRVQLLVPELFFSLYLAVGK
jgi:hypothetical protein